MNNIVFMVSYKKNINGKKQWNEITKYTKENFKDKGFKVNMVEGYFKKDCGIKTAKPSAILFLSFDNSRLSSDS